MDAGNYPDASTQLQKVAQTYAGTDAALEATLALNQVRLMSGQAQLAVDELRKFVAATPGGTFGSAAHSHLAMALENTGKVQEATAEYLRAAELAPDAFRRVDALLAATQLPAAADTPAARPLTRVYLWQFDSSKTSPIASITDATPEVNSQYPPLPAGVVFHHWAPSANWLLLGGCFRYRVVVTGSVPPTPSTFGLASSVLCNAPSPSPKATVSPTTKATP